MFDPNLAAYPALAVAIERYPTTYNLSNGQIYINLSKEEGPLGWR